MGGMNRNNRLFVCDFETTVYDGQIDTLVWAAASVEIGTEDVNIFHSIGELYDYLVNLKSNLICYFHNLKFDGSFWIDFLLVQKQMEQACIQYNEEDINSIVWLDDDMMPKESFKYSISDRGQWYTITIKTKYAIIEIRDSLKLLPFSVERIGKSFGTKHKKSSMEYTGFRYPGCEITDEEKHYIANDVLVVKEALEIMFAQGHDKLTIGACCLAEFKKTLEQFDLMRTARETYKLLFPNLYEIEIDENEYGSKTAGDYIRKSYRGGWCYLVRGKENKVFTKGITADVNSLYPSVMSGESGSKYPVCEPKFWKGNYIPDEALDEKAYYFVRIRTRFFIKKGKLPFVQIKGNLLYTGTEMLETTDVYNRKDGKYYEYYIDLEGNRHKAVVEMTLTMTDWILLKEHYHLVDLEILDGCYFYSVVGVFDEYINKYAEIKKNSKGAVRESAKLFLNNLYGKMASSTDSSFKVAFEKEDGVVGFYQVQANEKTPGYIAVGSAITSYARNFTIRAAQLNYHGVNSPGFIYADTDSIHCDLDASELKGIPVDPVKFCHWKLESTWDFGLYVRQKTYIEHVTEENLEPIEKPYYSIKCAGMPEKCKQLFLKSCEGGEINPEEYREDELEFVSQKRELTDFKIGLKVPGKLMPKRIRGGLLLVEGFYEMR